MLLSSTSEEAELYSGLKGGMIVLWDLSTSKIKLNLQGHSTVITAMSIYRYNNAPLILASASGEGKIKMWDLKSKTPTTNLKGNFSQVDCLTFSPDFNYLASGAQDGTVRIWDIRQTNKLYRELTSNDKKPINCVKFNPIEKMMAFGSKDKTVKYYDCEGFMKVAQTTVDRLPIEQIHFESKGDCFFIATNEALKYWKIADNTQLQLVDMFETGWSKLQSFDVIEDKAVYGLSSFSNKLSYYQITYDQLFKDNRKYKAMKCMPDIMEDVRESNESTFINNNESIQHKINSIQIESNTKQQHNILNNNNNNNNVLPIDLDDFIRSSHNTNTVVDTNNNNTKYNNSNTFEPVGISQFIDNYSNMSLNITKDDQSLAMSSNNKHENENILLTQNINHYLKTPDSMQLLSSDNKYNNNNIFTADAITNINNPKDINNSISNFTPISHNQNDTFNTNTPINPSSTEVSIQPPLIPQSTPIEQDPFESKADISVIHQSAQNINEESFLEDPFILLNTNDNASQKDSSNTNSSFISYRSNAPMGIDLNQFINANTSLNDTVHPISQSHDLAIIEEINSAHDKVRKQISTRYNNIKVFCKHWQLSNIDSTLYGLTMTKDVSAANDFFNYAILARKDVSKIPFTLDHYLTMLKLVRKQFDEKYETYSQTGCKMGGKMIELLNDKITIAKKGMSKLPMELQKEDLFINERIEKCDLIISEFKGILNRVKHIIKKVKRKSTLDLMKTFIMELDFFLKPYVSDGGSEIKIAN